MDNNWVPEMPFMIWREGGYVISVVVGERLTSPADFTFASPQGVKWAGTVTDLPALAAYLTAGGGDGTERSFWATALVVVHDLTLTSLRIALFSLLAKDELDSALLKIEPQNLD